MTVQESWYKLRSCRKKVKICRIAIRREQQRNDKLRTLNDKYRCKIGYKCANPEPVLQKQKANNTKLRQQLKKCRMDNRQLKRKLSKHYLKSNKYPAIVVSLMLALYIQCGENINVTLRLFAAINAFFNMGLKTPSISTVNKWVKNIGVEDVIDN